jgi:hypothetical protein
MKKIQLNDMDLSLIKTALHKYKDFMQEMIQKTNDPYPFEVYGWIIEVLNDIKTQTK